MKHTKQKGKLVLHRDTLRILAGAQLGNAVGGKAKAPDTADPGDCAPQPIPTMVINQCSGECGPHSGTTSCVITCLIC